MSSLREEIAINVYGVAIGAIRPAATNAIEPKEAIKAILAILQTAVLAAAPKKQAEYFDDAGHETFSGYNKGVEAYTKALQQLFESEG